MKLLNPTQIQLHDESQKFGEALGIVNPTNEKEVAEAIRQYREHGITIQGTRTGTKGLCVPHGDVILGTAWMKWVWDRKEDGDDILVHVGAGITLDQLDEALAADYEGYMWPPRPLDKRASIGGIAATGASGINACHYGETRNYIEAVKLIDMEGEHHVIDAPDTLDEVIGSCGKLGVITDVTVRLVRKPEAVWAIALFFEDEREAAGCAQELKSLFPKETQPFVTALEFIDRAGMDIVDECRASMEELAHLPAFPENMGAMIYIEFAGAQSQMMMSMGQIVPCSAKYGSDPENAWVQMNEAGVTELRAVRFAVSAGCNAAIARAREAAPAVSKLEISIPREGEDFAEVLAKYREDLKSVCVRPVIFGHIYNNNLHVNLLPEDEAQFDAGQKLIDKWVTAAGQ